MPPKTAGPSKKTEQKKKEKIIEDKTFGMKNKKGAKQQKFIQQIQKQVTGASKRQEELKREQELKKKDKEKEKKELNTLFRPVVTQKIEKGADPKSVVCAFFKQGQCTKGNKCKFSHDMNVERKGEKRSAYHDLRSEDENMDDWDDEKLREVVDKKHSETNKKKTETKIICKYFLDALENSKYGWFWECPNGEKCIYKHALPPGFVLKKDKKKEDKKEEISIEDLIERERAALGGDLTKVTLDSFKAWKRRKIKEKIEANRKAQDKKKADYKSGRCIGLSGRDMFTFNPEMADEDQAEEGGEAFDTSLFRVEDIEDELEAKEVDFAFNEEEDMSLLNDDAAEKTKEDSPLNVPIDENLFAEDDEDLEELEEHLEALDVS